jgi:hypothetical protein
MSPVLVGNVHARVRFSSALLASCVFLSFWNANQQPYGLNSATVHYSVTTQTAEGVFTTATAFYVCDGLEWDAVLGRDFAQSCSAACGPFIPFLTSSLLY